MSHTIKDIAASLGLSAATVSRALHDEASPFVSQKTRLRVREAAQRIGYRPNPSARALATGRSHMFGMWMTDPYPPFYTKIGRCVHRLVDHQKGQIVVKEVRPDDATSEGWPAASLAIDGALAVDLEGPANEQLLMHLRRRVPVVSLGVLHVQVGDWVGIDLYPGARAAVEHLIQGGARRIGFYTGPDTDPRFRAYQEALAQAGLPTEVIELYPVERSVARRRLRDYIRERGCPDALFCKNDDIAMGAYRALRDLGLRIPEDVALVGCDGIEDVEYLDTPITSIVQPVEEMCRLAWQFLENRVHQPDRAPQQATLQAHLVIRESSSR